MAPNECITRRTVRCSPVLVRLELSRVTVLHRHGEVHQRRRGDLMGIERRAGVEAAAGMAAGGRQ